MLCLIFLFLFLRGSCINVEFCKLEEIEDGLVGKTIREHLLV